MKTILCKVVRNSSLFNKKSIFNTFSNKEYFCFQWPYWNLFGHLLFVLSIQHVQFANSTVQLLFATSKRWNDQICINIFLMLQKYGNHLTLPSWFIFLKKFLPQIVRVSVICWSLDILPHHREIKEFKPCGVITIKWYVMVC